MLNPPDIIHIYYKVILKKLSPQLRDTRVDILNFLGTFLERISVIVRGWEKNYAVELKVQYIKTVVGRFLSGLVSRFNVPFKG